MHDWIAFEDGNAGIRSFCTEFGLTGFFLQVKRGGFKCFLGASADDQLAEGESWLHLLLNDQLLKMGLDVSQSAQEGAYRYCLKLYFLRWRLEKIIARFRVLMGGRKTIAFSRLWLALERSLLLAFRRFPFSGDYDFSGDMVVSFPSILLSISLSSFSDKSQSSGSESLLPSEISSSEFLSSAVSSFSFMLRQRLSFLIFWSILSRPSALARIAPISFHFFAVNGISLCMTESQQKPLEDSMVYVNGMSMFLFKTALAVDVFSLEILKMQEQQRKQEVMFPRSLGSYRQIQQLVCWMLKSGPYIKTFFLTEWPCKSRQMQNRFLCSFFSSFTNYRRWKVSGKAYFLDWSKVRLRSLPKKLVRQLPAITPSGLSIGITQKIQLRFNSLAAGSLPHRNSSIPSATYEELDSPGCILPVTSITFLLQSGTSSSVISSTGTFSPESDFSDGMILAFPKPAMTLINLPYPQGMQYAN